MIRPGYEQQHLSGEAAFRSFVPASLQEVVRDGAGKNIAEDRMEQSVVRVKAGSFAAGGEAGNKDPQQPAVGGGIELSVVSGGNEAAEGWLFDAKIRSGAERIAALIDELNQRWSSLGEQERCEMEERMLRAEAEQSVMLAYPVKPEAAGGACAAGAGSPGALSSQDHAEGISWDLSMLQALSSVEKQYTLEDVPDEFRWMAEMDFDHLYHAAKKGLELLDRLPLSGRLLKEIHYIALYGPHYDKLYRGEFRNSPVWIGLPDGNLHSAEFVPPVEEAMRNAFSEMEKFIHYEEETDPMIKAVLLHYQFETIHPFLDGNGRLGRLLVQLYLREFCGLQMPWIPLSRMLIRGMDRYYRELRLVQTTGDYFRWTCWFTGILKDALEAALQEFQQ